MVVDVVAQDVELVLVLIVQVAVVLVVAEVMVEVTVVLAVFLHEPAPVLVVDLDQVMPSAETTSAVEFLVLFAAVLVALTLPDLHSSADISQEITPSAALFQTPAFLGTLKGIVLS